MTSELKLLAFVFKYFITNTKPSKQPPTPTSLIWIHFQRVVHSTRNKTTNLLVCGYATYWIVNSISFDFFFFRLLSQFEQKIALQICKKKKNKGRRLILKLLEFLLYFHSYSNAKFSISWDTWIEQWQKNMKIKLWNKTCFNLRFYFFINIICVYPIFFSLLLCFVAFESDSN